MDLRPRRPDVHLRPRRLWRGRRLYRPRVVGDHLVRMHGGGHARPAIDRDLAAPRGAVRVCRTLRPRLRRARAHHHGHRGGPVSRPALRRHLRLHESRQRPRRRYRTVVRGRGLRCHGQLPHRLPHCHALLRGRLGVLLARTAATDAAHRMTLVVPVLALASALVNATSTILVRRGYQRYGVYTAMWINLAVGTAGVWAAVVATGGMGPLSPASVAYFALAGLVGTVAGRLLRFKSIETVGASTAAAVVNLSPLVSTLLAIVFLGERVTAPVLVGTIVIIAGTTLLSTSGRGFTVRLRTLLLPLLSAACF